MLTTPLLEGLDGVQKMSKSLGNYVGIAEPPGEQFGKLMSIPDALMPRYFQLTTGWLPDQVESTLEDARGPARWRRSRPSGCWPGPSSTCTTATGAGEQAEAEFDRVFKDHAVPDRRARSGRSPASELPDPVVPAPGAGRAGDLEQGRPAQDRAGRGAARSGEGDRSRPGGRRPPTSTAG